MAVVTAVESKTGASLTAATIKSAVDDAPVFDSTAVTTATEDVAYSYSITASDPDSGASLTISATTLPVWLTLTDNGDGTAALAGTPANAQVGDHGVVLEVSDGSLTATQSFTITVSNTNDAPVAGNDTLTTAEDTPLTITVATDLLANDTDADGDSLTVTGFTQPANGTVVDNGDGTWTYTPAGNFNGTDSFTYTVSDGNGGTDTATVNLTVTAVNDAPTVAAVNLGSIAEDGSLLITQADLLTGSADVDLDGLSAVNLALTSGSGTLTDNGDGTWTFTPTADWNGAVSFIFDVFDGTAAVANTASLAVTAVSDAPVFGGVNTGALTEEGDPDADGLLEVSGTLTIADPDPGESNFQAGSVVGAYGSLTIDAVGNWTYAAANSQTAIQQLDTGESISEVLTVTAADGTTHNVTITINGAEDAPSIGGTFAGTVEKDGVLTVSGTLLIADADASDNPISFTDVAGTTGDNGYGNFVLIGGVWTYTLKNNHSAVQAMNAGDTLTDTHTFTATDGSTRVVTITIGVNAPAGPLPIVAGGVDHDREPEGGGETTAPRLERTYEPDEVLPAEDEGWSEEEFGTAHAPALKVTGIAPFGGQMPRYFIPTISWTAFDENGSRPDVNATGDGRHLQDLAKALTTGAREVLAPIFSAEAMNLELDRLQMQIDDYLMLKTEQGQVIIGTATGIGASVLVGYVIWALRGSSLLFGALSAMPMWRCFDPLPVLTGKNRKQEGEQENKTQPGLEDTEEKRVRELLDAGSMDDGTNPSPGGVS